MSDDTLGPPTPESIARLMASYRDMVQDGQAWAAEARNRAGMWGQEYPAECGHMLPELDAFMAERGIPRPKPFREKPTDPLVIASGRPPEGPPALPPRRWSPT